MEKKFTNIPEVIDPGITIPIFEEDVDAMSLEQPQKLGSYRARAGKFSNTLSNLLPSISAKLHHSKKQGKGAGADPNASTPDSSESAIGNLSAKSSQMFMMNTDQGMPSMAAAVAADMGPPRPAHVEGFSARGATQDNTTPPRDADKLVHFPESTEYLISRPRTSNDSFGNNLPRQISRTRNNTMSSQITSISSIVPKP